MKWNRKSRRFFLQGAGAALALPMLRSLAPEEARASTEPKSFIGIGMWFGMFRMYGENSLLMPSTTENAGSLVGMEQLAIPGRHPIHHGSLTEWAQANGGFVSDLIDEKYSPYLDKMLMLQGLDYIALGEFHHSGQFGNWNMLAGSTPLGNPPMASLDVVLADYFKSLGLPGDTVAYTASWMDMQLGCSYFADGTPTTSRFMNPAALWDKYYADATLPTEYKTLLVDRVLGDYKALRSNPRLGGEDRHRLEAHISHLAATEAKLAKLSAVCAQLRPDESIVDRSLILRSMNDVIVGLIACGFCHSFMGWATGLLSKDGDEWHMWSHEGYSSDTDQVINAAYYDASVEQNRAMLNDMCLDLVGKLADNDLLDNCLVVAIQEHNKRGHQAWNVPVLTFGSAGGALRTNQYVDYRNIGERDDMSLSRFGFPINQLYATVLRAMGMPVSAFEALNKDRADGLAPFKANSGYGIPRLHPENGFGGVYGSGPGHYGSWDGHDMSAFLPLLQA